MHFIEIYMAGLAMMVGGAIVNAFAFSGSNFLFHKLSSESEERKRHDKAMEKLIHNRDSWVKKRQDRIDFINNKLRKERNSEFKFTELSKAMEAYAVSNLPPLPPLGEEPKLELSKDDSENQHFREIAFITGGMIGVGYIVTKLYA